MNAQVLRLYDNTRVSQAKACMRSYLFRHVLNWTRSGKKLPLIFGSSWHAGMDVIWANAKAPEEKHASIATAAYDAFVAEWVKNGMPSPDDMSPDDIDLWSPRIPQVAHEMFFNYIDARQHLFQDPSFEVLEIEKPFAVPLDPSDESLFYVGRLDKVFRFHRKVHVMEHKCLGEGTLVLKSDGSSVPVERVKAGDLLLGPDGTSRKVVSTCSGVQELFKVSPKKGESYIVNKNHILSLKMTGMRGKLWCGKGKFGAGDIANVPLTDYVNSSAGFKANAYGWKPESPVEFDSYKSLHPHLPPYILGAWLGDGTSSGPSITSLDAEVVQEFKDYAAYRDLKLRVTKSGNRCPTYTVATVGEGKGRGYALGSRPENYFLQALKAYGLINNKHVPDIYKTASIQDRLELLAGFIDTDGSLQPNGGGGYRISQKNKRVVDDICFVARSLGIAAWAYPTKSKAQTGPIRDYFWLYLSGKGCQKIPCRISRKRAPKKLPYRNTSIVGIRSIKSVGPGRYYGFELEGPDHLFLLADFTVTHNTSSAYRKSKASPFRADFLESFSPNSQIDGYLYALRMLYGDEAGPVYVDAALVHKEVHDGFAIIPVDRQFAQLDAWLWEVHTWIDQIEGNKSVLAERAALATPYLAAFPKNTSACGNFGGCPYRDLCTGVANPASYEGVPLGFKVEPWSPFDEIKLEKLGFTVERAGETLRPQAPEEGSSIA